MAGKTDDDLQHALEAALKVLGLTQREMAFPHMRPIEKEGDITPGDMLAVLRKEGDSAVHTGIYVGNGDVVDLWGVDKEHAQIGKRRLFDFNRPSAASSIVDIEGAYAHDVTVKIALTLCDMAKGRLFKIKYNVLEANCQHFATFCRNGRYDGVLPIAHMRPMKYFK
jgi:hypothetical protein